MSTTLLPGRAATAVLLTFAAVGEVVEATISPLDGTSTTKDLDAIAAHQGIFQVSVVIGLVATLLYLPGLLGLAQVCWAGSRRLAATAGWLLAGSMAGFVAIRLGQAIELAAVKDGVDHRVAASMIDHSTGNAIGAPILVVFLGGASVGLTLLAVAGWRAGLPKPACILLAVFQPLDLTIPQHPFPLPVVSHLVLLIALGWIAGTLRRPVQHIRLEPGVQHDDGAPTLAR
jgi:hypothetical protein